MLCQIIYKVGFAQGEVTLKDSLKMRNERSQVCPLLFNASSDRFLLFRTPNSVSSRGGRL
jgi:hypothetical protein